MKRKTRSSLLESHRSVSFATRAKMRAIRLEWLAIPGAAAQASVPGVYAWAVTVVPIAWGHSPVPALTKVAAVLAPAFLVAGVLVERWQRTGWGRGPNRQTRDGPNRQTWWSSTGWGRGPNRQAWDRVRTLSLWAFTLSCAGAWSSAPTVVATSLSDAAHAAAGMLGWTVFAFSSAGPPLGKGAPARLVEHSPLGRRRDLPRGDMGYVAAGALFAVTMQLLGWHAAPAERALFVRLIALAAGLAILGAWTEAAIARHGIRAAAPPRARLRAALVPIILLIMLAASAVLLAWEG
jgi:hypothetical protein